uniref:Uncharacterized protein n=1 Tax=Vespula pensylvanica TaxID=30213 RepID=A0A834UFJ9_VESPE|nr:hypothetical protein H0235_003691 [Vespula pensylvanica]
MRRRRSRDSSRLLRSPRSDALEHCYPADGSLRGFPRACTRHRREAVKERVKTVGGSQFAQRTQPLRSALFYEATTTRRGLTF